MKLKIQCLGYFDELFTNTNRICETMSHIEAGIIRRPELEILDEDSGVRAHLALLEIARNPRPIGWLVTKLGNDNRSNYIVCKKSNVDKCIENVMFCGGPELIKDSAILDKQEAANAAIFVIENDMENRPYILQPLREVFLSLGKLQRA